MINWLKGKKSYFVGAGTIGLGVFLCIKGDTEIGAAAIALGFSVITGRASISKVIELLKDLAKK